MQQSESLLLHATHWKSMQLPATKRVVTNKLWVHDALHALMTAGVQHAVVSAVPSEYCKDSRQSMSRT
jgi:hypothetical protein